MDTKGMIVRDEQVLIDWFGTFLCLLLNLFCEQQQQVLARLAYEDMSEVVMRARPLHCDIKFVLLCFLCLFSSKVDVKDSDRIGCGCAAASYRAL